MILDGVDSKSCDCKDYEDDNDDDRDGNIALDHLEGGGTRLGGGGVEFGSSARDN